MEEAEAARLALGVQVRQNLGMPDGFFAHNDDNLLEIIRVIRHYKPEIVIANAPEDRHPDHGRGASLVRRANFLAGLAKIETTLGNKAQDAWRGHKLFHYIQFKHLEPDILVDIRGYANKKKASLAAYKSQFYNPESTEPETMISSQGFMKMTEGRDAHYGGMAAIFEAEGFVSQLKPAVDDLFHLLGKL
jgi:bacillithiol biosynthesis deacetylase BshB1